MSHPDQIERGKRPLSRSVSAVERSCPVELSNAAPTHSGVLLLQEITSAATAQAMEVKCLKVVFKLI